MGYGVIGGANGYDFGKLPDALPEEVSAEQGETARAYIKENWRRAGHSRSRIVTWRKNFHAIKNGVTGGIGWGKVMPVCLCTVCGRAAVQSANEGTLFAPAGDNPGAVWLGSGQVHVHTSTKYHQDALAAASLQPSPVLPTVVTARSKGALSVQLFQREVGAAAARAKQVTSRRVKRRATNMMKIIAYNDEHGASFDVPSLDGASTADTDSVWSAPHPMMSLSCEDRGGGSSDSDDSSDSSGSSGDSSGNAGGGAGGRANYGGKRPREGPAGSGGDDGGSRDDGAGAGGAGAGDDSSGSSEDNGPSYKLICHDDKFTEPPTSPRADLDDSDVVTPTSDDGVYEVDYWQGRNIDSKLNKFVQIADPQPLKISLY
eukprot:COSAG01_NODE_6633_length_3569_cov_13.963689_3_plen_373_part_00